MIKIPLRNDVEYRKLRLLASEKIRELRRLLEEENSWGAQSKRMVQELILKATEKEPEPREEDLEELKENENKLKNMQKNILYFKSRIEVNQITMDFLNKFIGDHSDAELREMVHREHDHDDVKKYVDNKIESLSPEMKAKEIIDAIGNEDGVIFGSFDRP